MIRRAGNALARTVAAAAVALGLALGGVGTAVAPAAASPLPIEQCTATSGVVLAVDLGHWGGPLLRSCGTTPTTGYALLNQGGWKTTGTGHDGPAFICRIGYSGFQGGKQYPTPDQDKCVLTPPATAYWSYWHADPGQNTWSYSQLGAMSYQPKPGSVDLWIFGGTNIEGTEGRPAFSPDSVRAHNTAPGGGPGQSSAPQPPSTAPAGGGSGGGNANGGANGGGTKGGSAAGGSGGGTKGSSGDATPQPGASASDTAPADPTVTESAPASPSTATDPASATAFPTAPASPSAGATIVDAAPAPDAPHSAGSIAPAVTGAALVVALGTATAVTALRRRRRRAE
ncbi:hypothetical protein AB0D08_35395 [Kitasatospora sp. NPDC048540]|uniref:hypothetical protein n=1 Tax=Kitasatospora sp. NPDC048540 TaxID=3155634 RepID=UPI0033DA4E2C